MIILKQIRNPSDSKANTPEYSNITSDGVP